MLKGFWTRSRGLIGLDMGRHSVRLMQLEPCASGWKAVAAAQQPLLVGPTDDAATVQEATIKAIRKAMDGGQFVGNRVVSTLPSTAIQYKNLRVPKMPPHELKAAVEWEAADRFHLPVESMQLQYFDAGEVRQGDDIRQEVILMAASIEQVESHVNVLTTCGLQPVAVEAVPSALARSVGSDDAEGPDVAAHVVVDIGWTSTKVLVARRGRVIFFKLIDIGGAKFDEAVSRHMGVSLEDAAALRRRHQGGEVAEASSDQTVLGSTQRQTVDRALFEALRPVVADLAREIQLCLRYYSVTFRGRRPDCVQLAGGESHGAQLRQLLRDGAGINMELAQPLRHVDTAMTPMLAADTAAIEWAVAAGLAMRQDGRLALKGAAREVAA